MSSLPRKDDLTVLEAVDNLSSMAELDVDELSANVNEDVPVISARRWLNVSDTKKTQGSIDQTFRVIHKYLKHLGEKESEQLKDAETQKGIEAIMSLAKEAAENLDTYNALFQENASEHSISNSKEFQALENYYMNKLTKRFESHLDEENAWLENWEEDKVDLLDVSRMGLKDLETVKKDKTKIDKKYE